MNFFILFFSLAALFALIDINSGLYVKGHLFFLLGSLIGDLAA